MKDQTYGEASCPVTYIYGSSYSISPTDEPAQKHYSANQALAAYKGARENGTMQDAPLRDFPEDGSYVWKKNLRDSDNFSAVYEVCYREGSKDKKWMKEKDENYLNRLIIENNTSLLASEGISASRITDRRDALIHKLETGTLEPGALETDLDDDALIILLKDAQDTERRHQLHEEGKELALANYHRDNDIGTAEDLPSVPFPMYGSCELDNPDDNDCFTYTYVAQRADAAWYAEKTDNYTERLRMALITATKSSNKVEVMALLDARSPDIHETDSDGMTALHHAAESGYFAILKLLLTHGADATIEENNGLTPLELLEGIPEDNRTRGHLGCTKRLTKALAEAESSQGSNTVEFIEHRITELQTHLTSEIHSGTNHVVSAIEESNACEEYADEDGSGEFSTLA